MTCRRVKRPRDYPHDPSISSCGQLCNRRTAVPHPGGCTCSCFGYRSHRGVDTLKANLTKTITEVKSSHRVEALGRGLGFKTYAALRAAAQSIEPSTAVVSGASFAAYLAGHGFEVDPTHIYRAAAQVAINGVLERMPRLSIYGIGFGRPQRNEDNTWETPQQCYSRFAEQRQECQGLHASEAFLLALTLLSRIQPTKTITSGSGSYRLKHIAENYSCTYPEGAKLGPRYVPNGMLIAAAVHMGFKYKMYIDDFGYDLPNMNFNMSKRSIDELDFEIRPNMGGAHHRIRRRQSKTAGKLAASMPL